MKNYLLIIVALSIITSLLLTVVAFADDSHFRAGLYPLLEREISPSSFALGGCYVTLNGPETVFLNPAGLFSNTADRRVSLFFKSEMNEMTGFNSGSEATSDVALAVSGQTPLGRLAIRNGKILVAAGIGLRGYNLEAPSFIAGPSNNPVEVEGGNYTFGDNEFVFAFALAWSHGELAAVTAGVNYHWLTTDFDDEIGKGKAWDIGLQSQFFTLRKYQIEYGLGITLRGYGDKKWSGLDYFEKSPYKNTFRLGHEVGIDKPEWFLPSFYNDFSIHQQGDHRITEIGFGLKVTPFPKKEKRLSCFDLLAGFRKTNSELPGSAGNKEKIKENSIRLGAQITIDRFILDISASIFDRGSLQNGSRSSTYNRDLYGTKLLFAVGIVI